MSLIEDLGSGGSIVFFWVRFSFDIFIIVFLLEIHLAHVVTLRQCTLIEFKVGIWNLRSLIYLFNHRIRDSPGCPFLTYYSNWYLWSIVTLHPTIFVWFLWWATLLKVHWRSIIFEGIMELIINLRHTIHYVLWKNRSIKHDLILMAIKKHRE